MLSPRIKNPLIFLLGSIASAVATLAVARFAGFGADTSEFESRLAKLEHPKRDPTDRVDSRLENLERRVLQREAETQLRDPEDEVDEADLDEADLDEPTPVAPVTEEEAARRAVERCTHLREHMEHEPVDRTWEAEVLGQFERTLQEDRFDGVRLEEAACGSTLCRIVVSTQEVVGEDPEVTAEEFFVSEGFKRDALITRTDENTHEVYLARRGTNLVEAANGSYN